MVGLGAVVVGAVVGFGADVGLAGAGLGAAAGLGAEVGFVVGVVVVEGLETPFGRSFR